MSTPYHAAFAAHALTRRSPSDDFAKLGASLISATVDLNPHQLDAALFAFKSPLSRGVILADEVGLGKTIEAGLIASQLWSERRRRILVICPTILRKQWAQELADKFFLPSVVFDSKEYNAARRSGDLSPLDQRDKIVICSYHFAWAKSSEISRIGWDLVVIDEAHRLRNVYRSSNKIANGLKSAVSGKPIALLTATPLQNSLLELFGLVSFLDEHLFGSLDAFRARYMRGPVEDRQLAELRQRLAPICQRTLRKQVVEFIKFTNRIPITVEFAPNEDEQRLYESVSTYLQREKLHALPSSQRKLMTLILRKLLASSTFAIAGTLRSLVERLRDQTGMAEDVLSDDFESYSALAEEWESNGGTAATGVDPDVISELREIMDYAQLASSIQYNAKGEALLKGLSQGFDKLSELGAKCKAVIFTESKRTQGYLRDVLESNGYAGRVLTINGTNSDDRSGEIYRAWVQRHRGSPIVSGNKTVDLRAALVEHFRDHADILIATEAAAEGVNLQFCSLVVNYDLPWNPQRVEQRIGRCHRYGQTHDVVVINFVNSKNAADQRVFELLSEKFRLFDGVFGSSDEVLGAVEDGIDFERRIADIYQSCRTKDEIEAAFQELREELDEQIKGRLLKTRADLFEHFDQDVQERLRISHDEGLRQIGRLEQHMWLLLKASLGDRCAYDDEKLALRLEHTLQEPTMESGTYRLVTRREGGDEAVLHLGHPLIQNLIERASSATLPAGTVCFDYHRRHARHGILEPYIGKSGWMSMRVLTVESLDDEDRCLCAAFTDDGEALHVEACERLFQIPGSLLDPQEPTSWTQACLREALDAQAARTLAEIADRNAKFFGEEMEKLERWADDLKHGLETELKDLDARIKQADREARSCSRLEEKLALHRDKKELEGERSRKRKALYEAQDEIDRQKDELLSATEARLAQKTSNRDLLTIRWSLR
ncbi:MAG: DEAD/DEAH box helicase family protein [Fimbriimonadaceae bacterium]|nr:DEAD/DEAH box helicase family protein [Fimbriimonadaceae bacterium]